MHRNQMRKETIKVLTQGQAATHLVVSRHIVLKLERSGILSRLPVKGRKCFYALKDLDCISAHVNGKKNFN